MAWKSKQEQVGLHNTAFHGQTEAEERREEMAEIIRKGITIWKVGVWLGFGGMG